MVSLDAVSYIRNSLWRHDKEVCGVVDTDGCVHPIANVSTNRHAFIFSKRDYAQALNTIKAKGCEVACIYHSHIVGTPAPSAEDIRTLRNSRLPMLIITLNDYRWIPYES